MTDTATRTDITPAMIDAAATAMVHTRGPGGVSATYTEHAAAALAAALPLLAATPTERALRAELADSEAAADTWRRRAEHAETALAVTAPDRIRLAHIHRLRDQALAASRIADPAYRSVYRWVAAALGEHLGLPPDADPPGEMAECTGCGQRRDVIERQRDLIATQDRQITRLMRATTHRPDQGADQTETPR